MKAPVVGTIVALIGLAGGPLEAQQASEARSILNAATLDPSLRSPVLAPLLDLKLEASSKDKSAAIAVGGQLGGDASFHLKLTAPIDSSADQTELADLRGLKDSATLEFGLKAIFGGKLRLPDLSNPKVGEKLNDACLQATGKTTCGTGSLPFNLAEEFLSWERHPMLLGVAAQVGKKSFDWTDRASLKKNSETHLAYSVTFAAGVFPLISMRSPCDQVPPPCRTTLLQEAGRGLYYIGVNGRYEVFHKNATKTQLCTPLGVGGASTCDDVFLGAPSKKDKRVAELEIRKYFGPSFLANPRFNWDFKNHVEGVEMPLYFIKGPKGGLNGGVTLGWRSDTHALTASVFVGEIADIWPK